MSGSDRDLVAALRAELAAVDPSRPCDRMPRSRASGRAPVTREGTRRPADHPARAGHAGPRPGARSCCRRSSSPGRRPPITAGFAWLRGRFLARGSLSLAGGPGAPRVRRARRRGAGARRGGSRDVGLPASWRAAAGPGRRDLEERGVDRRVPRPDRGERRLLELEARSVARSLRGELNRVINAESANLQRSVAASGRQLAAIDALEADGRLAEQPRIVRAVAEARRETPEASLSEMAARLELHRSAVQRALDRLERLALHDDEGIGRRRRRGPDGPRAAGRSGRREAPAPLA